MCGIVGFIDDRLHGAESHDIVSRMSQALIHRGPDDSGTWTDDAAGLALGHRRLSIVDLSPLGHQPMISACGRYVLTYNGEIYNYRALRAQLDGERTHAWRGHSDTEVLLEAIAHWGLHGALQRCVGMFALAVWDRQLRRLSLARDRLGEKPLYYGQLGTRFLFASELKALRHHPEWQDEIDRDVLWLYMQYGYVPAPFSIYRNVYKLAPGCTLTVSRSDSGHIGLAHDTYWSAADAYRRGSAHHLECSTLEATSTLDRLLRDAVALQMVADVPLGAFLSGGVDSSTVVALMQAQSSRRVKTFSIGFQEKGFNEAEHAARVARHLGTDHTELYVTPRQTLDLIPRVPSLFDEPLADSSLIPTYLVAQLARRDVTVALSGDGGDELFFGYRRFIDAGRLATTAGRLPMPLRHAASTVLGATCGIADTVGLTRIQRLQSLTGKLRKAAHLLQTRDPRDMYWELVRHWRRQDRVVLGAKDLSPTYVNSATEPTNLYEWMMCQDLVAFLPDDVLVKVDRTSMAVSLEARAPLLDHRVVEFASRVPLDWKYRDGRGKWLLRQVLYKYVPPELVDRPKMGFQVPIDVWLRGDLRDWAESLLDPDLLRKQGYFDTALIRRRWQQHLAGTHNWRYCLWSTLMFQAWQLAPTHTRTLSAAAA